jgi:ubiquinone/menaquinone biosynthesis C-methylase UbiE
MKFKELMLAHKYCTGTGLEIGGSAHNPFGLKTKNVDFTKQLTSFKKEEINLCGEYCPVDIEATGEDIPLPDESQDFIVSSHVLEHFTDPIKALLEWCRLIKKAGLSS